MRKILVVFISLFLGLSVISAALAGDVRRGTVKAIDEENRTILFSPEGTIDKFKMNVGPKVDLSKVKVESRVKIYVEGSGSNEEIKVINPRKPVLIIGC